MGVLQMPRLKGADVQFIIYIPHDGPSISHEAKIKKKKKTTTNALSHSSPCALLHPLSSSYIFPSRSHQAKRPFSFSSPHFIFLLSLVCLFLPRTTPVFFSPCALPSLGFLPLFIFQPSSSVPSAIVPLAASVYLPANN